MKWAGAQAHHLFQPRETYRTGAQEGAQHYRRDHIYGAMIPSSWKAQNPPEGAILYYYLAEKPESMALEILDGSGNVVRKLENNPSAVGMHRVAWNLRYPGPKMPRVMAGPRAVPGTYQVRFTAGDWSETRSFEVKKDPRLTSISHEDLQEQFDFLTGVRDAFDDMHRGLETIRSLRSQVEQIVERAAGDDGDSIQAGADSLLQKLSDVENELIQTKGGGWSHQPKIRAHLSWVATAASSQRGEYTDARPTDQLQERFRDLKGELDGQLAKLQQVVADDVARFNSLLSNEGVQPLQLP